MSANTHTLNLWGVLSESKRIINAHSRHFLALSVLFLLPLSFSLIIYPIFQATIFESVSPFPDGKYLSILLLRCRLPDDPTRIQTRTQLPADAQFLLVPLVYLSLQFSFDFVLYNHLQHFSWVFGVAVSWDWAGLRDSDYFNEFSSLFWDCACIGFDWAAGEANGGWTSFGVIFQMVVCSGFATLLMLQNLAANVVLYMYCKAYHGELAFEIAEEFAVVCVCLLTMRRFLMLFVLFKIDVPKRFATF
ncbi:hypothetical protein HAX54_033296 [Datura stramonium]|uniref:Uncharacterized protein n=1 Tax=Datura stramonium TaxID=4076 RepID=A0ABS8SD91_DATST|nr:hypothetical protein [Datura stramonium]